MSPLTRSKPESPTPRDGAENQKPEKPAKAETDKADLPTAKLLSPVQEPEKLDDGPVKGDVQVSVDLEMSRQKPLGWTIFGTIFGALLIWKLGTVGVWAGFGLVAVGIYRAWELIQTFLYPPA
jgi:hypothetical protein